MSSHESTESNGAAQGLANRNRSSRVATWVIAADDKTLSQPNWSAVRANAWQKNHGWRVGCNFIPSSAINQLEMWQKETFDPKIIDKELGYAAGIGMSAVRVFLHDLVFKAEPKGFIDRIDQYLIIACKHGIKTLFVFFDDCWNSDPRIGKQPKPIPGVHNSGWVQSPSVEVKANPSEWSYLEDYVKMVVGHFAEDDRIYMWDIYNEPGNMGYGDKSLPLLQKVFEWARAARPLQPLTAGWWKDELMNLNAYQFSQSDIISFHNYGRVESVRQQIRDLKEEHKRPVVCTEWMARPENSVEALLSMFKEEQVSCFNWGLVAGKTQTIYPWNTREGTPEPEHWFHDLLYKDGSPYKRSEIELFRGCTNRVSINDKEEQ